MAKTSAKTVWVRVLNEAPLFIRRRASAYLKNIRKTSENEWMIWSDKGARYRVRLKKGTSYVLLSVFSAREGLLQTHLRHRSLRANQE